MAVFFQKSCVFVEIWGRSAKINGIFCIALLSVKRMAHGGGYNKEEMLLVAIVLWIAIYKVSRFFMPKFACFKKKAVTLQLQMIHN